MGVHCRTMGVLFSACPRAMVPKVLPWTGFTGSTGKFVEMQILRPHFRPTYWIGSWQWSPTVDFNKPSEDSAVSFKFKDHHCRLDYVLEDRDQDLLKVEIVTHSSLLNTWTAYAFPQKTRIYHYVLKLKISFEYFTRNRWICFWHLS